MGRYVVDDLLEAEEMFERLIGYSFAVSTRSEIQSFSKHTGYQIKLREHPLKILKCEGYLKYDPLKFEGWVEVTLEHVSQLGKVLDIPPSIFQVPYDKVRVE